MKKASLIKIIIFTVIAFLVITNPNLKQFKEDINYTPEINAECPSYIDPHTTIDKGLNLFVCSFYTYSNGKYIAIAGNVFRTSTTWRKHEITQQGCTIYSDKVE